MLLLLACTAGAPTSKIDAPDTSAGVDTEVSPADSPVDTASADTDPVDSDSAPAPDTDTAPAEDPVAAACRATTEAATTLLAALPAEQADAIQFDVDDPNRLDWSNLPVPSVPRDGVQIGQMSVTAQAAAWELLRTSLSDAGYAQAEDIVFLDDYNVDDALLGSEYYTWAIYGTPSTTDEWAWQFDGHHLVYTFTVRCPDVVMAPNLLGAYPMTVPDGDHAGLEALGDERDAAYAVLQSLDVEQAAVAVPGAWDHGGLEAGPGINYDFPNAKGLAGADLDAAQQELLLEAIELWVDDQDLEHAALRMAEIEADLDETYFYWIGDGTLTDRYYFRIQGPSVYIEWDCNDTYDHVHAVYRNPVDDYGGDVLAFHYAHEAHAWGPPR